MASDPVTGISNTLTMLLTVAGKAMDMLPDYEQRKRKEFHTLKTAYEEEKSKSYPHRDDNLVGVYRDRLMRFLTVFSDEISRQKVSPVPGEGDRNT